MVNIEEGAKADLALNGATIDDDHVYSLVMQEFSNYENYRITNYDPKWSGYDALYFGRMQQKMWEGTKTPRASLPKPISYDQVETALPAIVGAVFGPSTDWFQVQAEAGTSPLEAQAVGGRLKYLLDHCKTPVGTPARAEIKMAIRQALMYGNGFLHVKFDPELVRSTIEWVDTKDIFIDPGCPSPNVDESRALIRRYRLTVDELDAMRHVGMNIPDIDQLRSMGTSWQWSSADQTKQITQNLRGVNYTPGASDYSSDPNARYIEVLVYYTTKRIVWVLNRKWVCYNGSNPYSFIPFVAFPCIPIPGSFYGMGLPERLQPFQRYGEALQNGRLDELSLNLHPPRAISSAMGQTPTTQAWRPGATYVIPMGGDPKNAAALQYSGNVTAGISEELNNIEIQAEKTTGINTVMQGIPRPGNANRTAGGMAAQTAGGQLRLSEIVQNIEDYGICPMLDKLLLMEKFHQPEWAQLAIRVGQGDKAQTMMAPSQILQAPLQFHMTASTKMLTREKLLQELPMITQNMLSGPMLGGLQAIGKTIDWDQYFKLVQDALGIGESYVLVRDMNDQEKQAQNQPPPQVVAKQQADQQANQTRLQMGQMKSQTELQTAQLKSQTDLQRSNINHQGVQIKAKADVEKQHVAANAAITETDARDARHILGTHAKQQDAQHAHDMALKKLELEHAHKIAALKQQHMIDLAKHLIPGAAKPVAKR